MAYTWTSLAWFAAAFVAMTAVWTLAGIAVVEWFEPSALGEAEADLSLWLEDQRTTGWDDVATVASVPSNTPVKIGLIAVLGVAFPLALRRWHDWAFLLGALVLEVSVYGLSSYLVGRPRPPVERLASAPTESFPSGHVAAATTFYIGLALIVSWHTTNRTARTTAWLVGALIPIGMCLSRLYLGMHYVSDVVAGLALGAVSLVVALHIARDGLTDTIEELDDPAENTRAFDLTA